MTNTPTLVRGADGRWLEADAVEGRKMHLQVPGVRAACGEARVAVNLPDGGAVCEPMTTHEPWVTCAECLVATGVDPLVAELRIKDR